MPTDLVAIVREKLNNDEARAKARAILGPTTPTKGGAITASGVKPATPTDNRCLLLDVSGSMGAEIEPGKTAWDALNRLSLQFAGVRRIAFSTSAHAISTGSLPRPNGGTDMAAAFEMMKKIGCRHGVLITDGEPNDEFTALNAAKGLRLDIFYVGAGARPAFLDRLAAQCGGTAQSASLKSASKHALEVKIKGLLT